MQISIEQLAQLLNGTVIGNGDKLLHTVAKIEEGHEGALSFLANPKYENYIYETKSTAVLVNNDFVPTQEIAATLIKVENAYTSFTFLLEQFASISSNKKGIEANSVIASNAKLGSDVYVGALAFVGENAESLDSSTTRASHSTSSVEARSM